MKKMLHFTFNHGPTDTPFVSCIKLCGDILVAIRMAWLPVYAACFVPLGCNFTNIMSVIRYRLEAVFQAVYIEYFRLLLYRQ